MSRPASHDVLYVGYHPVGPPWVARIGRRVVVAVASLVGIAALARAAGQGPVSANRFEYGEFRDFEGLVVARPVPALLVPRPGRTEREAAYSRYVLVGEGKHGVGPIVNDLDAHLVHLRGHLLYRENQTMLEIVTGSMATLPGPSAAVPVPAEVGELGSVTITGEIVDSKCFLGAMNPATRTIHRGCAVRCLSGGLPPLVVVRDTAGVAAYLYLTGPKGEAVNRSILHLVGVPVTITGRVERRGDLLVLLTDPTSIHRIS